MYVDLENTVYVTVAYKGYMLAEFERKFPDGFLCRTKPFKNLLERIDYDWSWMSEDEKAFYKKAYGIGKVIIEDAINIHGNPTLSVITDNEITAEVGFYAVAKVITLAESMDVAVTVISDRNSVQKMIKEVNSKSNNPEDMITKGYNDIKSRIRWIVGKINRVKNGEMTLDKDEYVDLMTEWKKLKDLKKKYEEILEELTETMDITINSLGSDMLKIASEVEEGEMS